MVRVELFFIDGITSDSIPQFSSPRVLNERNYYCLTSDYGEWNGSNVSKLLHQQRKRIIWHNKQKAASFEAGRQDYLISASTFWTAEHRFLDPRPFCAQW